MSTRLLSFVALCALMFAGTARRAVPIETSSSTAATAPLTLVVLVDITASQLQCPGNTPLPAPVQSMAGRAGGQLLSTAIGTAYGQFPNARAPEGFLSEDRVELGSIGRRLTLSGRFASSAAEIRKDWQALFDVPPVEWLGPSPIWDAVEQAATALANEPGRRAIALITDGQASGNAHGQGEVAAQLSRAGVSVSVVALESMLPTVPLSSMSSHGIDPTLALRAMAYVTGGTFELARAEFPPDDKCFTRDPAPAFKRALDHLHEVRR